MKKLVYFALNKKLRNFDYFIWEVIQYFNRNRKNHIPNEVLQMWTGLSQRSISSSIQRLEDNRLLIVRRKDNNYRLLRARKIDPRSLRRVVKSSGHKISLNTSNDIFKLSGLLSSSREEVRKPRGKVKFFKGSNSFDNILEHYGSKGHPFVQPRKKQSEKVIKLVNRIWKRDRSKVFEVIDKAHTILTSSNSLLPKNLRIGIHDFFEITADRRDRVYFYRNSHLKSIYKAFRDWSDEEVENTFLLKNKYPKVAEILFDIFYEQLGQSVDIADKATIYNLSEKLGRFEELNEEKGWNVFAVTEVIKKTVEHNSHLGPGYFLSSKFWMGHFLRSLVADNTFRDINEAKQKVKLP